MFILLPISFVAGILTSFTPCALPVLPIVLASGLEKRKRTTGIIVGLIAVFVLMTVLLSAIVKATGISAESIRLGSIAVLFILGLILVFPQIWAKIQPKIELYWRPPILGKQRQDFLGGFLTGGSLGVVWTPCVGPIVASVTALTAASPLSLSAWAIAISYGLGIGLSLSFIAFGGSRAIAKLAFLKRNQQNLRKIFGAVVVITAIFLFTNADRILRAWAIENLPQYWSQAGTLFQDNEFVQEEIKKLINKKSKQLNSDKTFAKINLNDLEQGCPGQDCIPSIDNPKFESRNEANKWLRDDDLVFGLDYKGEKRAYSQRILNWHEIVNDTIAGDPVLITFCPLCGSALVFERRVNGKTSEFGVSGKLINNNLVMYDRNEENLWQQVTGEAVVGAAAKRGEKLKKIRFSASSWSEWKKNHPDTKVLSRDTGYIRDYDLYPYGTYEEDNEIYFGLKNRDVRLPLKEVVYGFDLDGKYKAYSLSALKREKTILDTIQDTQVKVEYREGGEVLLTVLDKQKTYVPLRTFWFAWAAFHPGTELYK